MKRGDLMVHYPVKEFKFGEFKFVWEYDTGMGPGGENIVYTRGPLEFTRCFYFEEANERHIENFCKKFARDKNYRQKCLEDETSWAQLSELYELNAQYLGREYKLKYGSIFIGYLATDKNAKRKHEELQEKYLDECHELYHFLKEKLNEITQCPAYLQCEEMKANNSKGIDDQMKSVIAKLNQIPEVETQFSCQGVSESIEIDDKTIFIPDGHQLFAHVVFKELSDNVKNFISSQMNRLATWSAPPCRLEAKKAELNHKFREKLKQAADKYLKER